MKLSDGSLARGASQGFSRWRGVMHITRAEPSGIFKALLLMFLPSLPVAQMLMVDGEMLDLKYHVCQWL